MNRNLRMLASFGMAVFLHGLAALAVALSCGASCASWTPVFLVGESGLELSVAARIVEPAPAPQSVRSEFDPVLTEPDHALEDEPAEALPDERSLPQKEHEFDRIDDLPVSDEDAQAEDASASKPAPEVSGTDLERGVIGAARLYADVTPYYPLGARMRGEEGVVRVRIELNADGSAARCAIERSSGFPALDRAALHAARRARYVAAQPEIKAAGRKMELDFRFQLTD